MNDEDCFATRAVSRGFFWVSVTPLNIPRMLLFFKIFPESPITGWSTCNPPICLSLDTDLATLFFYETGVIVILHGRGCGEWEKKDMMEIKSVVRTFTSQPYLCTAVSVQQIWVNALQVWLNKAQPASFTLPSQPLTLPWPTDYTKQPVFSFQKQSICQLVKQIEFILFTDSWW